MKEEQFECPTCKGVGWTAEHSHHHGESGECLDCPVQVQCQDCEGTGVISLPDQEELSNSKTE